MLKKFFKCFMLLTLVVFVYVMFTACDKTEDVQPTPTVEVTENPKTAEPTP